MIAHKQDCISHYDFKKKISMVWIQKDKCCPNTEKITSGNYQTPSNRKSSIPIANPIIRRTLNMPFLVSSNSTDIKCPKVSEKFLDPGGFIRKRLTQAKYCPIKMTRTEL